MRLNLLRRDGVLGHHRLDFPRGARFVARLERVGSGTELRLGQERRALAGNPVGEALGARRLSGESLPEPGGGPRFLEPRLQEPLLLLDSLALAALGACFQLATVVMPTSELARGRHPGVEAKAFC